ncbi:MAG: energy-coupling factor transporter transmembrane component T [Pseudomonadota bacterium]
MAGISPFGYRPGASSVHRLDPRLKLGAMAAVSMLSLYAGWAGLLVLSVLLAALAFTMGFSFSAFFSESRYVMLLLALIIVSRAIFTPGTVLIGWGGLAVSQEGLAAGGLVSWRLLCILLAAALVIAATSVEMLSAAVTWFLRPVPLVNEQRVGVQLALVIRFIPLILHQAAVSQAAQRARCIDHLRRPIRRMHLLIVPLMRRVFLNADRMALAMAARCYSEPRTRPPLAMGRADAAAAVVVAVVALAMILL